MNEEIFNLEEFLDRVQEDKELLLELLDIFQEDYQEKRKALTEVLAQKDAEQLRHIAHALKGASGNISAKRLHQLFAQLEIKGKEQQWDGIEDMVQQIDDNFEALTKEMARVQQEFSE